MKPQLDYAVLLGAHFALPVTMQPPLEDLKDPVLGLLFNIPDTGVFVPHKTWSSGATVCFLY